jgi:1-acyl-sn-glycerol-3-phosphate acyltransferase
MNRDGAKVAQAAPSQPISPVYNAYLWVRSGFRWLAAGAYFFVVCPILIAIALFVDPRKNDWPQRWLSRTVMRLAGAHVEVYRSPGFDPKRTVFFVSNHVNLFDPFLLYGTIPQFIRGLELESHFRIPVYGWLMKRFGNVPVPDTSSPSDLKRMWRLTRKALDDGISLVVFPEGRRTITGRVSPFRDGVFRMAIQFGVPIVPVSIVGAFDFNRKTSWLLRPARVIVHLHDVIETASLERGETQQLMQSVWEIVASPVHGSMDDPADER